MLAHLGESSLQLAPQRLAACALQQRRLRHALDVRDCLVLARLGESSMPRRSGRLPVRCNSTARAAPSTCAIG